MLIKSLESRLMADVPLGFFLSGGVDSTLCAALIRKFMGREVNTYDRIQRRFAVGTSDI